MSTDTSEILLISGPDIHDDFPAHDQDISPYSLVRICQRPGCWYLR